MTLLEIITDALMEFQCEHTVQDDDNSGMPLLDMLTPEGDTSVDRGFQELHALADHIAGALHDALWKGLCSADASGVSASDGRTNSPADTHGL